MFRFIAIALLAAFTIGLGACAHKDTTSTSTSATTSHHTKYSK